MALTLPLLVAKWLWPQALASPSYKEIFWVVLMGTLATSHWLNQSLVWISRRIGRSANQEGPQCVCTLVVLSLIFQLSNRFFIPLVQIRSNHHLQLDVADSFYINTLFLTIYLFLNEEREGPSLTSICLESWRRHLLGDPVLHCLPVSMSSAAFWRVWVGPGWGRTLVSKPPHFSVCWGTVFYIRMSEVLLTLTFTPGVWCGHIKSPSQCCGC